LSSCFLLPELSSPSLTATFTLLDPPFNLHHIKSQLTDILVYISIPQPVCQFLTNFEILNYSSHIASNLEILQWYIKFPYPPTALECQACYLLLSLLQKYVVVDRGQCPQARCEVPEFSPGYCLNGGNE
jgi:hypothetical protein